MSKVNLFVLIPENNPKFSWINSIDTLIGENNIHDYLRNLNSYKKSINHEKYDGYFDKNSTSDSNKSSFITFIHRLLRFQQNDDAEDKDAMKLQIRRALHYLDHNRREVSLTSSEMSLMNDALDKRRLNCNDDALRRDMVELRSQHLRHWPNCYFLPWIKCYEEVDQLRKTVRYNWKEECINAASNSVAEPTKVIRRMDLLLNRFALLERAHVKTKLEY